VSAASVDEAGVMGSEVSWKQWDWPSSGLDMRMEKKKVHFYGSRSGRRWYTGAGRKVKKEIVAQNQSDLASNGSGISGGSASISFYSDVRARASLWRRTEKTLA
jgi:hypothetical protein